MRHSLERWLTRIWYEQGRIPFWLKGLEKVYALFAPSADRIDKSAPDSNQPAHVVIVVGNITVGGSGKTPLVIRLCELFGQGFKTGVVSRGYGRSSKGLQEVEYTSTAAQVGDEPLLIAQSTQIPVVVAEQRSLAVQTLLKQGVEVIIADDGLQHRGLRRDIEICVISAQQGLGNGHLLPAGPLRESANRLNTVDYCVINGELEVIPGIDQPYLMTLEGDVLVNLHTNERKAVDEFKGQSVQAFAGIGQPQRFFDRLISAGLEVDAKAFPDHYRYSKQDFIGDRQTPVVMTEKDAVKCRTLQLDVSNIWYLPVSARLPEQFEHEILARVRDLLIERRGDR